MEDVTFFEFVWFCVAACGYLPVAMPIMMIGKMIYDKLVGADDNDE